MQARLTLRPARIPTPQMVNPTKITVGGAPEGHDARLLLAEGGARRPVLHIARDDKRMAAMRARRWRFSRPTCRW